MPIDVVCSQGHALRLPDRLRGKRVICPACEKVVSVPGRPFLWGYRIAAAGILAPTVVLVALLAIPALFSFLDGGIAIGLMVLSGLAFGLGVPLGTGMAAVEKGYGVPVAILAALFGFLGLIYVSTLADRSMGSDDGTQ
jgi:hypothetical protein